MTFETVPVVHLDRGRFPEYPDADPEAVLTGLARRFERVLVVDAQGIRANDADLEFLQHAARKRAIWADAGSRYATDAMDLFVAGAERVTMRWNTVKGVEELAEAASLAQPGALFLGLEFPRREFLPHPKDKRTALDAARLAEGLGIGLVYIVDRPDPSFVRDLPLAQVARYVQGAGADGQHQAWGYAGSLVGPVDLVEEAAP